MHTAAIGWSTAGDPQGVGVGSGTKRRDYAIALLLVTRTPVVLQIDPSLEYGVTVVLLSLVAVAACRVRAQDRPVLYPIAARAERQHKMQRALISPPPGGFDVYRVCLDVDAVLVRAA